MTRGTLHIDDVVIQTAQVEALVADQFVHLAHLALAPVASGGTDNLLFRLGNTHVARFPRIPGAATLIAKESHWLPHLAPHLPLTIPSPIGTGAPGHGYPFPWSITQWIPGQDGLQSPLDQTIAARSLANFILALRRIDARDGPPGGAQNFGRGLPLRSRNEAVETALQALQTEIDTAKAAAIWRDALATPEWTQSPQWLHGDLHPGNLIGQNGHLTAVIDWGCLGTGDPAIDLIPGWTMFDPPARVAFKTLTQTDAAQWSRARGLALSWAMIALPYYWDSNPVITGMARRTIDQILRDTA